jgi:hypothetical protein
VLPILLALSQANIFVENLLRWDPSGRTIARELRLRNISADQLFVSAMPRGQQFSLNFYLNMKIKEWDSKHPASGLLLTGSKSCQGLVGPKYYCQQLPFDPETTGQFLYRVDPASSVNQPGNGR